MDGLTALHHAISEGHGDAAILLMKAGTDLEKRDGEGNLAIDLAPDTKVRVVRSLLKVSCFNMAYAGSEIYPTDCRARRHRIALMEIAGKV